MRHLEGRTELLRQLEHSTEKLLSAPACKLGPVLCARRPIWLLVLHGTGPSSALYLSLVVPIALQPFFFSRTSHR